MRTIKVIGIGAGHPEHITIQAINALRKVAVLFITDKGPDKEDLARFRHEICAMYVPERHFRTVSVPDPDRDRAPSDYQAAVQAWHDQRAQLYESLFVQHLRECEAELFWSGAIRVSTTAPYASCSRFWTGAGSNSNTKSYRESRRFKH